MGLHRSRRAKSRGVASNGQPAWLAARKNVLPAHRVEGKAHALRGTVYSDDLSKTSTIEPVIFCEAKVWTHRLGNLLLLNRRKNSSACNYDFDVKKERYFKSGKGVAVLALTTQVLGEPVWTPSVIERRQKVKRPEFGSDRF
ncbi:DUF1524 domain-containing protein [Corynebacterium sp. MSK041]|uniref:GmrSD restriction endonuclease domain-containing protein n=1 Tax=Corynebacterium sp. MSK041 TaxID=3050194 RepID=UPI00254AF366|nr:DUF1524 domain-containing protein [Corynebacterium sp. MSK041]MDK8795852.1 DUF1524 domain-containing protein [Corynebacterium sp. MSK041]